MLSRRAVLLSPLAVIAARPAFAQGKMTLAIHQNTSAGAGYRNCYHFCSGNNKLEDLDLLRSGEVGHVHAGALSVELFLPRFQQGDPFEIAQEIRRKAEPVMRAAGVL
jgi:hypothetical protein